MENIWNIKEVHRDTGRGGYYKFTTGDIMDLPELERRVKACYDSIDPYRSPSISRTLNDNGEAEVTIKYYGLD